MSDKTHIIQAGESLASVASQYGLSAKIVKDSNSSLVEKRGSAGLQEGDELVLSKETGSKAVGTGRTHEVVAIRPPKLLELRTYTEFRLVPEPPGDKAESPRRWKGGPAVMLARAKFTASAFAARGGQTSSRSLPAGGGKSVGRGTLRVEKLEDGAWTLELAPHADELSRGPARPDPGADHGLGFWIASNGSLKASDKPRKQPPTNGQWEIEYRTLKISIEVKKGAITNATVVDERDSKATPLPAVLFWKNVERSGDKNVEQVLEVDWKPDFIRRVVLTDYLVTHGPKMKRNYLALSPHQRARKKLTDQQRITPYQAARHGIELLFLHQTTGNEPGGTLNTFLNNYVALGKKAEGLTSGSHFLLDRDGHVIRLADDRYYTQHGGGKYTYTKREGKREPLWGGSRRNEVNERSIGIEICHRDEGADDSTTEGNYTEAQYTALIDLAKRIKKTYAIESRNVIGHQDATGKARCPGPHLDWERLEKAGISLAVAELTENALDTMFGGYFAGKSGRKRSIQVGDRFEARDDGTFAMMRRGKEVVRGLTASPSKILYAMLMKIGYVPFPDEVWPVVAEDERAEYRMDAAFCIGQFIRHFCTFERYHAEQSDAYKHNEAKFEVDFIVAKRLAGAFASI